MTKQHVHKLLKHTNSLSILYILTEEAKTASTSDTTSLYFYNNILDMFETKFVIAVDNKILNRQNVTTEFSN